MDVRRFWRGCRGANLPPRASPSPSSASKDRRERLGYGRGADPVGRSPSRSALFAAQTHALLARRGFARRLPAGRSTRIPTSRRDGTRWFRHRRGRTARPVWQISKRLFLVMSITPRRLRCCQRCCHPRGFNFTRDTLTSTEGTGFEPVSAFQRGGFQDRCISHSASPPG